MQTLKKIPIEKDVSMAKFISHDQAKEYADQIINVFEINFPDYQTPFTQEELSKREHTLANGKIVNLQERRNGTSVGLFHGDELVGMGIGSQEAYMEYGQFYSTQRGFFSHIAINKEFRGKNTLCLAIAVTELLFQKKCKVILGATSVKNDKADGLYSKFAFYKTITSDLMRYNYEFDPESVKPLRDIVMNIDKYNYAIQHLLQS